MEGKIRKFFNKIIKPETRTKIKEKAKKGVDLALELGPFVAFWLSVAAAWDGCTRANRAEKELKAFKEDTIQIVNHNADVGNREIRRVDELERKQQELLEKAMNITEGKEETEPKEAEDAA